MNEQIEAIRNEIKRRMEKHWDLLPDADSQEDDWTHNELCELGAYKELEHLETFIDSLPEGPDKSLEEAARHSEILAYQMPEDGDIEKVMKVQEARIFHEIGFKAGAEWQKGQMMKEAVEGTVMDFSSNRPRPQVDVLLDPHKYHTGDKVRIIIVKEDK